jgi:hypothetical protein
VLFTPVPPLCRVAKNVEMRRYGPELNYIISS